MGRVVLVTGVCRDLGGRFARRIAEDPGVDRVIGVDVVPPRQDLGDVRFVRAEVMETLNMDYVRTARAKGAPERTVIRTHVLRNAMLPVVTMVGMDIGLLLGGAIFIEAVFGLNGLGGTAIESIGRYDLPVLQGVVIFGAIAIIVFSLVVDLLYALGLALWTGTVVVVLTEIIPQVKERQILDAIDRYEAIEREARRR